MKKTVATLILLASVGFSMPGFAAEPALHEVYQAANSGRMDEAQRMMKEVLQAHPNSGKAHYVEAELLAKQGKPKEAGNELATAEKLAPGLPFATPQSVSSLKESIARHASVPVTPTSLQHTAVTAQAAHENSGIPWGMLLIGLGLIAFVVWASQLMSRRNALGGTGPSQPGFAGYRPAYPSGPSGDSPQGYGPSGAPPGAAPGLGSKVLGGLATGAAVGAGVVAGEALMHHFMDGNKTVPGSDRAFSSFDSIPDLPSTPVNDMGGNDFGISESSSWDDGGSGDSEWN